MTAKRLLMIGLDGAIPEYVLKFSEEGSIPNITKIMKNGFFSSAIPSPPCDTPTNWTTIATGAWTGTHGIASFALHLKGESLSHPPHPSNSTEYCRAEFIWDVAERVGRKVLIYNYHTSWPPTIKKGLIVRASNPTFRETRKGPREYFYPEELRRELDENVPRERLQRRRPGEEVSDEDYIKRSDSANMYQADCLKYLKEKYDWDVLISHNHTPDNLLHKYINPLWPGLPGYNEKEAERAWKVCSQVWNGLDKMVGRIVDECGDEDTVTVIVSDHGCLPSSKLFWSGNALRRAGLLSYKWDEKTGKFLLDSERSKVGINPQQRGYIWVNLKGREPDGIVEPGEEYERVREQVIQALYRTRDPETGECPVTIAARKEDLEFLGQWGDRCADVIYFVKPGYHLRGPSGNIIDRLIGMGDVGGMPDMPPDHGGYLPNTSVGLASDMAVLIMAGPGVRKGYKRLRPVNLVDVAPTMAHLIGINAPAQAEGKIIPDALERC